MQIHCDIPNFDDPLKQLLSCLRIIQQIDLCPDKETIELYISSVEWMTTFSALVLSNKIVQKNNIFIIPPKKTEIKKYLLTIGFPLGDKKSGTSYSPIYHFKKDATKAANHIYALIERTFPETAKSNAIKYLIGELCDNLEQHSQFTQASIMAQYFKSKKFVDIGFVDNGISIPKNFELHNIPFDSDPAAISAALDGQSTKEEKTRGRGLMSSEKIIKNELKGTFYICSRKGVISNEYGKQRTLYNLNPLGFNGTIVYFRFQVPTTQINIYPYV